jgi:Bacterial EndoU nuclease
MMPEYLMALDRPEDDFEAGDARLEQQHLRSRGPGGDVPAARSGPAEPRTREEYYEALRAADDSSAGDNSADGHHADDSSAGDSSADDDNAADSRTDRSGWDSIDEKNRPPVDAIRVSPERTTHILDGDSNGGGHRHGIGSPEKTEFPASWDDKKIMSNVLDVAQRPDAPPVLQHWNNRWVCSGTRDNVEVSVIVLRSGEVWTAWPEEGSPGVVRNPKKGNHDGNRDY